MMGVPPRTKSGMFATPKPPPLPRHGSLVLDSNLTAQEQAEEEAPVEAADQELMAVQDPLALAMLEQSKALTSLVSHLQSGGDPLIDGQGYASGTSSRGAQGRERLQRELTARSGSFFLTVMQNAFRRLKPATPVPTSLEALAETDFAMLQYLERYGNYAGARAQSMFSYKGGGPGQTGRLRAFAPLCPQRWATVALAYIKECDYIQSKRLEIAKKAASPPPAPSAPNPKKKGKFPKAKSEAAADQEKTGMVGVTCPMFPPCRAVHRQCGPSGVLQSAVGGMVNLIPAMELHQGLFQRRQSTEFKKFLEVLVWGRCLLRPGCYPC